MGSSPSRREAAVERPVGGLGRGLRRQWSRGRNELRAAPVRVHLPPWNRRSSVRDRARNGGEAQARQADRALLARRPPAPAHRAPDRARGGGPRRVLLADAARRSDDRGPAPSWLAPAAVGAGRGRGTARRCVAAGHGCSPRAGAPNGSLRSGDRVDRTGSGSQVGPPPFRRPRLPAGQRHASDPESLNELRSHPVGRQRRRVAWKQYGRALDRRIAFRVA
jgi:hypothetical protein